MATQRKRWEVSAPLPDSMLARHSHISPLLLRILHNRGLVDADAIEDFLGGQMVFHNPFLLKGMDQAVTRIRQSVAAREPIAVYGDFDADGVTAAVLLTETLQALGAEVKPYIPHRVDEGYGLHKAALTGLSREGMKLVVTVDCGIRSLAEVAYGRGLGLDMIITDHHSVGPELPPAVAVIDPKRGGCPYPFKQLAGVGVAFKLAQALLRAAQSYRTHSQPPVHLQEDDLLDLVALGTVADVVPLLGENRQLVRRGMGLLNPRWQPSTFAATDDGRSSLPPDRSDRYPIRYDFPRRLGLRALMQVAGLRPGRVTTSAVGFVLAPRLNAAGRLDSAMLSYDLLRSSGEEESTKLARRLEQLNRSRQRLTQDSLERARARAAEHPEVPLHLVELEGIQPGIAGLVAGRLTEELYRPTIIVERGVSRSRGSARSIPELDITAALDRCSDLLDRHGGHAAAAGFTVKTKRLPELKSRLTEIAASQLAGLELMPRLAIDSEVNLDELDWATYALLQQIEPCGHGNEAPVLLSRSVEVKDFRTVGADDRHLKLGLGDGRRLWDAIAFRQGEWAAGMPDRVDIAYSLEANEWNGRQNLQLNVHDLRPSE